jgi:hypothetical protein
MILQCKKSNSKLSYELVLIYNYFFMNLKVFSKANPVHNHKDTNINMGELLINWRRFKHMHPQKYGVYNRYVDIFYFIFDNTHVDILVKIDLSVSFTI